MISKNTISRDLHQWITSASRGLAIYTSSDQEFQRFVDDGKSLIEKSKKAGFDCEILLSDLLAHEIDIDKISANRLKTLMASFPITSKSIDFIGVDIDKRLPLLEARFVSSNGNSYKESAILQCFKIAAKVGSPQGYLKAVDLARQYFAGGDLYNEDTEAVLSAMLEGLLQIKTSQSDNVVKISEEFINAFNLIAKDAPNVQTKTLSKLLSSEFSNVAKTVYSRCNFIVNNSLFFENSYKSHGCDLSEDKITTLVNEHIGDEEAYEYLAELTRLKFARGDVDGYDKFFQAGWTTTSEVSFYLNICIADSFEYQEPLIAFSKALFRNADLINNIKSGAMSKIIKILDETEGGKLMLRHARKDRASAKHVISSDFEL